MKLQHVFSGSNVVELKAPTSSVAVRERNSPFALSERNVRLDDRCS
jgi:hypothetical protein